MFSHIKQGGKGLLFLELDGKRYFEKREHTIYVLDNMHPKVKGYEEGLLLDFGVPELYGKIHYGFIPYGDSRHPMPVYRWDVELVAGQAGIPVAAHTGRYDIIDWQKKGKAHHRLPHHQSRGADLL